MQWKNLDDRYGCYKLLSKPDNLNDIRLEVKRLLIAAHELEKEDFYTEADSTYLPKKLALKKRINYQDAFEHEVIAHTIALAHQRDESFLPITQAVQTVLRETHQSFSCLLILASGSGHLASYLASALNQWQQEQISHTIYGIDISSTMSIQSRKNFLGQGMDPAGILAYHTVTADCTSWPSLRRAIPELIDDRPILTISHGGARYFAQGNETELLKTLAAFPRNSQTIITEVGAELHHLMYWLSDSAQKRESFAVYTRSA